MELRVMRRTSMLLIVYIVMLFDEPCSAMIDKAKTHGVMGPQHKMHVQAMNVSRIRNRRSIDDAIKTFIVEEHNKNRAGEGSSDMIELVWDDGLAQTAQIWAVQCAFKHGQPVGEWSHGFSHVGQNLFLITGSVDMQAAQAALDQWFSEKPDFTYESNKCADVCGHYTQMVWANSSKIGCGVAHCPAIVVDGVPYDGNFFTCNYGPGGNIEGVIPFKKGVPCSACPVSHPGCVNNLCSTTTVTEPSTTKSSTTEVPASATEVPGTTKLASTQKPEDSADGNKVSVTQSYAGTTVTPKEGGNSTAGNEKKGADPNAGEVNVSCFSILTLAFFGLLICVA